MDVWTDKQGTQHGRTFTNIGPKSTGVPCSSRPQTVVWKQDKKQQEMGALGEKEFLETTHDAQTEEQLCLFEAAFAHETRD